MCAGEAVGWEAGEWQEPRARQPDGDQLKVEVVWGRRSGETEAVSLPCFRRDSSGWIGIKAACEFYFFKQSHTFLETNQWLPISVALGLNI